MNFLFFCNFFYILKYIDGIELWIVVCRIDGIVISKNVFFLFLYIVLLFLRCRVNLFSVLFGLLSFLIGFRIVGIVVVIVLVFVVIIIVVWFFVICKCLKCIKKLDVEVSNYSNWCSFWFLFLFLIKIGLFCLEIWFNCKLLYVFFLIFYNLLFDKCL